MEHICRRCLNLRHGLHVVKRTQISPSVRQIRTERVAILPQLFSKRLYATKDRTSERKYKHGKLIVDKVEDPTLYPNFLMIFSGADEAMLDSYLHTVKKAAKMIDVNLTKSFNMPAVEQTHKAKREGKGLVSEVTYDLKQYQRVAEIQDLTGEKSDIFLEYIHQAMPAGVQMEVQLKQWEKYVDPKHIMFRDE